MQLWEIIDQFIKTITLHLMLALNQQVDGEIVGEEKIGEG